MSISTYRDLKVGDKVHVYSSRIRNLFHAGVVSKVTPTGLIDVYIENTNLLDRVHRFGRDGYERGVESYYQLVIDRVPFEERVQLIAKARRVQALALSFAKIVVNPDVQRWRDLPALAKEYSRLTQLLGTVRDALVAEGVTVEAQPSVAGRLTSNQSSLPEEGAQ